jgi:Gas vesicle protein G
MGLLTGLLTLPLAPVRGTIWVAERVQEQAEREYYDPNKIRRQLEDVDRMRQDGELSEDEAAAMEDELLERLMEGQARTTEWEV